MLVVDLNWFDVVVSGFGVVFVVIIESMFVLIVLVEYFVSSGVLMYFVYWCFYCYE